MSPKSKGSGRLATVLLTGAGGAAIPDLIKHLKGLGHRVLTCDMNPKAPGLFLGDGGFVVPPAIDPGFGEALNQLCAQEQVDVLVPLVDEELVPLRTNFRWPAMKLVSKIEFIEGCLDKWALMHALTWLVKDVRIPHTSLLDGRMEPFWPTIIKPRRGRGSRGIHRYEHRGELLTALIAGEVKYSPDLIAQEHIEGPEYTVSVVCDQENVVHAVVPKEIILKQSSTRLAVTRRNEKIDALCRRIAEVMNPCGPFNVQLKLRDGEPYVFEINPRFSGTVNLTIAAGCDEVGGLIELALGRPYTFGEWREGVVLVRQTHDGIMSEAEFNGRTPKGWDT